MIVRDPLYTGDPIEERASVVLRIAPSFFRFGSFEIFNHTDIKTGTPRHSVHEQRPVCAKSAVSRSAMSSSYIKHVAGAYL